MRTRLLSVPIVAAVLAVLVGCSASPAAPPSSAPAAAESSTSASAPASSGTCVYKEASGAVREVKAPSAEPTVSGTPTAVIATSAGDLTVTLDATKTKCTTNSFVSLSEQGFYNDTTCHRLTTQNIFVLQCGDPSASGMGGPGYGYANEVDGTETYPAGTLAMAHSSLPDSNGSQFFLVYKDSPLPPDYTVFGTLDAASLATLQAIGAKGTADGTADGKPAETVTITGVTVK